MFHNSIFSKLNKTTFCFNQFILTVFNSKVLSCFAEEKKQNKQTFDLSCLSKLNYM